MIESRTAIYDGLEYDLKARKTEGGGMSVSLSGDGDARVEIEIGTDGDSRAVVSDASGAELHNDRLDLSRDDAAVARLCREWLAGRDPESLECPETPRAVSVAGSETTVWVSEPERGFGASRWVMDLGGGALLRVKWSSKFEGKRAVHPFMFHEASGCLTKTVGFDDVAPDEAPALALRYHQALEALKPEDAAAGFGQGLFAEVRRRILEDNAETALDGATIINFPVEDVFSRLGRPATRCAVTGRAFEEFEIVVAGVKNGEPALVAHDRRSALDRACSIGVVARRARIAAAESRGVSPGTVAESRGLRRPLEDSALPDIETAENLARAYLNSMAAIPMAEAAATRTSAAN